MTTADAPTGRGVLGRLQAALLTLAGRGKVVPDDPSRTVAPGNRTDTEFAQQLVAALPDATILLTRDGAIVCFNAQAQALAPALRRGEPVSVALRAPELLAAFRAAAANDTVQRVEFSDRTFGRWSEAFVSPVWDAQEHAARRPPWFLLTLHDLTPIRRVEEMRADFVANASHELRTPLAALSGFIDTLKGPARNDVAARERFLDIMQAQARRMARLIDDLLSLSRIELAAHLRPVTPLALAPLLGQVADALQTLAQDRGVAIAIHAPQEPVVVAGDRDELIRALENLVENALKYGGSGGRVDITLARARTPDGEEAIVTVRDYGPGIAAEHLPRLTERFYRVDVAGSRAQGGTGLGLALVKHILNRHGGRLEIASRLGEGARFTMHLPLSPARPSVDGKVA